MSVATMTGGQALVQSLKKQGIDAVFALPGVQLDWAFDALYEEQDAIKLYHVRHEQATSYMADGYARTTGRVGTCLVVPGPGLLNAMAGLSTAYACCSPVLCVSGQVESRHLESGRGMLHEIPNQLEMVRSVTKWSGRAMRPEEVPGLVAEAFRQLRGGRPRPVEIEIPPDVFAAKADVEIPDWIPAEPPALDPDQLEAAARILGSAQKPLIFVGGGIFASGAWEELKHVAELLDAPVVMSNNGRGALSSRHYLAQNLVAGPELMPQADAVLVVGTRFAHVAFTSWRPNQDQPIVQIDIDPEEVGRNQAPAVGIVADAKQGLAELSERLGKYNRKRESREAELTALKEQIDDLLWEVQPQASYGSAIRDVLPDDGIVVNDMTQVSYWANLGFPVYEPRTFLTPGYQGTLGCGFAIALGAQAANPDKKVLSLNGDGGFMYNVQELSTAVRHKLNLVTVVFSDDAFGNVKRIQKDSFKGRYLGSDLLNPDFVKLAESFGMPGIRAQGAEALRSALEQAFSMDSPVLIDVPIGEVPRVWSFVTKVRS